MLRKLALILCMLAACLTGATAQQKDIDGVVIAKDNHEPLGLVIVWVKGSHHGMTTHQDGHFDLPVNEGDTLEFSAKGYKSSELVVGPGNLYKAELEVSKKEEFKVPGVSVLDRRKAQGNIGKTNL